MIPTKGDEFAKLIEHLRLGQEAAATLSHLHRAEDANHKLADGWLAVSEGLKATQYRVTALATRGLQ